MICCCETGMLGATAEPGFHQLCSHFLFRMELRPPQAQKSHTNSVPHCPIVNATQMYHIQDSWFARICYPILVKQVSGSLGDRFANLKVYARAYAEPTRGYAISSVDSGVLGSPKVLRFFSRRSIPDLHKTNHSCAPNCLEIFLNKPIIGTKQANHN